RPGYSPVYAASGHLVYLRSGGVLMAAPFDASRLEVTGPSVPVLNGVSYNPGGAGHFALAGTGTLVYMSRPGGQAQDLIWVDRTGHITPIDAPRGGYRHPVISPDGGRVAMERADSPVNTSIVVWDFNRKVLSTVTRDTGINEFPIWTAAGDRLVLTSRP